MSGPVVITGAGGQLGTALSEVFPSALALTHADWDVTSTAPAGLVPGLVLHAAAWTSVDEAETNEDDAYAANARGTRNAAAMGAPVVAYSSDYVFDGTKETPYVESDATNPVSAYGRTKLAAENEVSDGWVVRTSWLFGASGNNFLRTMLRLGASEDEVSVVDDQVGCPTYVGHLAEATKKLIELPGGVWHLAAQGQCSWADFAETIFEDAALPCRVRRVATSTLNRPAPRPAYSVLRSERAAAPELPHWREGLRACLGR